MRAHHRFERLINICLVVALLVSLFPMQLQSPAYAAQESSATVEPEQLERAISALQASVLDEPLAVSRVQSSYVSNEDVVVTFTVTNNHLPTYAPEITESTTVTDTLDLLAAFSLTDDMNTLRNVTLATTLTNGTLVDGNGATQVGSTLTWMLPDIAPQQSTQMTVTLSSSASGSSFVELDNGALVSAELWTQPVSAQARPVVVIPDTVDAAYMADTVDADVTDADMLWVSADFQQEPLAAFAAVRDMAYDPYQGSLRGTRGTLWSTAGNALDQSSLLIAMLRSAGVPARYRHGTLSLADAQTLIASLFPADTGAAGYQPGGTAVADPVNDADLIALVSDHWWVEAYLPGSNAWVDLDPSFATATVGDSFATPAAGDRVAELPADQRHTVTLSLEVERYTEFPTNGTQQQRFSPLTQTFSTAELAGHAVTLAHIVSTTIQGGLIFASTEHAYTPYFKLLDEPGGELGDPFSDLLTSVPFATQATLAQWLHYEVTDPNGNTQQFTRVVKDLLGPEVRLNGGVPQLSFDSESEPFIQLNDLYVSWFLPNDVPTWALQRQQAAAMAQAVTLGAQTSDLLQRTAETVDGYFTAAEDIDFAKDVQAQGLLANQFMHAMAGLEFAETADRALADTSAALFTNAYYAQPRIFTVSLAENPTEDKIDTALDLRTTTATLLAHPGQSTAAPKLVNWVKGISESALEGAAITRLTGVEPVTTNRVFEQMQSDGIAPVFLTSGDYAQLDALPLPADAKALISQALAEGKQILVPGIEVVLDAESTVAWWQYDPQTGETISVGEGGLHLSAAEMFLVIRTVYFAATGAADQYGFINQLTRIGCGLNIIFSQLAIAGLGGQSPAGGVCINKGDEFPGQGSSVSSPNSAESDTWRYLPAHLCPGATCGIAQFFDDSLTPGSIPLPDVRFRYQPDPDATATARATITETVNGPGAPSITLTTSPAASTITPDQTVAFDALIDSNFADRFQVMAYAPDGWNVTLADGGAVTIQPASGAAPGDYTIALAAQSETTRTLVTSAEHTVTILAHEAVDFSVSAESNITIPQNEAAFAAVSRQTNDGEAEIPDSAYRVDIRNQSTTTKTFTVSTSGAPAGWIVLDAAVQTSTTVTLRPGAKATLGLYIIPTALPAPGTSHTIDVTISDSGSLSDSAQINWAMPGQAHNFVTVLPETIYMGANDSAEFAIAMQNVGNVAGAFPVTATTPITTWALSPLPDFSLAIGASNTQTMTLTTVNGEIGRIYPLQVASPAPGSYTQYAFAQIAITSPDAEQLGETVNQIAACSADPEYAALFDAIFSAFNVLEVACSDGNCNSQQRDAVVTAVNLLVGTVNTDYPALDTSAISSASAVLAAATTVQENLDALPAISASVSASADPICAIAGSQPALQWTPAYDAALTGESVNYALDLTNLGTLTSTYALTVELPTGQFTDAPTLDPGATETYNFPLSSVTPALIQVAAEVVADATPLSNHEASAALNVVDKFIQLTAVTLDPEFVETGSSQTDVSVTIANLANVPIDADALVAVLDDGGVVDSAEIPILIRPGNPRSYDLTLFDTSGYASGVYTVTVDLVDVADSPIDDGSGYAYLGVGQALGAAHSVAPELVMPGTVSVTTVISTEILVDTAAPTGTVTATPLWEPTGLRNPNQPSIVDDPLAIDDSQLTIDNPEIVIATTSPAEDEQSTVNGQQSTSNPLNRAPAGYTRTEASDTTAITYSGGWVSSNFSPTSDGNTQRSFTSGDTASFNFTGTWVNLGFVRSDFGGSAEIFIDGTSQGVVDLYGNHIETTDIIFSGLPAASHTISFTTQIAVNPLSSGNKNVYLDYIDTWDGTAIPNGTVEQDSGDVLFTSNMETARDGSPVASGGTYARGHGAAWIPFSGDSISTTFYKDTDSGPVDIYIDGQFDHRIDLYSISATTETLSFSGFGTGFHLMTLRYVQDRITLDQVTTPATGSDYVAPVQTGIMRIEEWDSAIRYDGLPYTSTNKAWTYYNFGEASRGRTAYNSGSVGRTVSYDFTGDWVSFGVVGTRYNGKIQVIVDGGTVVSETVDTYRNGNETINKVYDGLGAGAHTITLTVLSDSNPHSGNNRFYFDYFESWDGSAEPSGAVEADLQDLDRIRYSFNWGLQSDGAANNGDFVRGGVASNAWFHFTGDSVTYEALDYTFGSLVDIRIDGEFIATFDLDSTINMTRPISFDGLGAGPHILHVTAQRSNYATIDRFHAPASTPATALPSCSGYCRYEENHPALRFNGDPFPVADADFTLEQFSTASDAYLIRTTEAGNTVSLTFTGESAEIGFLGYYAGGMVDVTIDGSLVETVDTYRTNEQAFSRHYDLDSGSHSITLTLNGAKNPNASQAYLYFDYIDVWDGTALPTGTIEAEDVAFLSSDWAAESNAIASGGDYLRSYNSYDSIWIPFEGDSVQLNAIADRYTEPWVQVTVDGVRQDDINLWHNEPITRSYAFDGFGSGAHLLQLSGYRQRIRLDTVTVPATIAAYHVPMPSGIVRYEEHDLTYDGTDSWEQRASNWYLQQDPDNIFTSVGYSSFEAVTSGDAGHTASLTFDGEWINVGLMQRPGGGSAEIIIDNTLVQTIALSGAAYVITETQFTLTPGTHTVAVRVVGDGQVVVDFIDVWDGTATSEALTDVWLGDADLVPNVHFSNANGGVQNTDAIGDRYMYDTRNTWYTFVGDSFTFYAFSSVFDRMMNVYIDGQFVEPVNLDYDFTPSTLAYHFNDLGDGPHSVRVVRDSVSQVDGFISPATNVNYGPLVEWYDDTIAANALACGICVGLAAGDINGDGVVEIIAVADTPTEEKLIVYRGDGADAGGGTPILWEVSFGSAKIGSPAIGDLDPAYPGSEIVVMSTAEMRVYHADGTLWWSDSTIKMQNYVGAPAIGNMDADPEPEIVVNDGNKLIVLDADGTQLWSTSFDSNVSAPMLADLTGDGLLDIVVSDYGTNFHPVKDAHVYLYDYNLGSPNLVWTYTLSTTLSVGNGLFGSHAVADIDGLQPGGDDGAELAISHAGYLTVLNDDGTLVWSTELESGDPGGVTIADVDGDGEVEIITGMKHEFATNRFGKLYAVNADGSILWNIIAEDSTSANSASVLDLNGDGIYEVAWNGLEQGFNIFNGVDGSTLFHEPAIFTRSGSDYPIIADVDGDDSAEIIIPTQYNGAVVLGFDGLWGDARTIWNQQTYHITNVNDDLTIPASELNSWDGHNTYKTQTPEEFVLPIFGVTLTHTVGTDGLSVDGFNVTPDVSADPDYLWNYVQTVANPTVTRTLDIELSNMEPGETRLVATGTVVSYTLGSGQNSLTLPPLYVTSAKLIAIEPFSQTVGAGGSATFVITLINPTDSAENYTLKLPFLSDIGTLPATVNVPANSSVDVSLTFDTLEAMVGTFDFIVLVNGGTDSAAGRLVVVDALDLALSPPLQSADPGQIRSYNLTITNTLPTQQNIALSVTGLLDVNAPANVVVDGNASETVVVTAQGFVAGQLPFTINGENGSGASDSANGILAVNATQEVSVVLNPDPAPGGPGMPSVVTVTVINEGSSVETFDLAVNTPAGWQSMLTVDEITLTPFVFNSAEITLLLTPPVGTAAASYPYSVTVSGRAESHSFDQPAAATAFGIVDVGVNGVVVGIDPVSRTVTPSDMPSWNVTVTNTGSVQNTFALTMTGIVALSGSFTQDTLTLNPGEATTVQLNVTDLSFAVGSSYLFAVVAIDQDDSTVRNQAYASMMISPEEDVIVSWYPDTQMIDSNATAYYMLTITNTGNLVTEYDLNAVPLAGTVNLQLAFGNLLIPAHSTAQVLVSATADAGTYQLEGSAESDIGTTDSDQAELIVNDPTAIELVTFTATVQPDQTVLLAWETAVEIDNVGFNVYRSTTESFNPEAAVQVNTSLIVANAALGQGATYELLDDAVQSGSWYYFLEDVDMGGKRSQHGPVLVDTGTPTSVAINGLNGVQSMTIVVPLVMASLLIAIVLLLQKRQRQHD